VNDYLNGLHERAFPMGEHMKCAACGTKLVRPGNMHLAYGSLAWLTCLTFFFNVVNVAFLMYVFALSAALYLFVFERINQRTVSFEEYKRIRIHKAISKCKPPKPDSTSDAKPAENELSSP
jgi:sugar (pentulose or hexulose) kinase